MVAVDGTLLGKSIELSEEDFVQEKVFDRDPDKEEYQGYMGNYGPEATHFYHDTVQNHTPNLLSCRTLTIDKGCDPSAFPIPPTLASTESQSPKCEHQYMDAALVHPSEG